MHDTFVYLCMRSRVSESKLDLVEPVDFINWELEPELFLEIFLILEPHFFLNGSETLMRIMIFLTLSKYLSLISHHMIEKSIRKRIKIMVVRFLVSMFILWWRFSVHQPLQSPIILLKRGFKLLNPRLTSRSCYLFSKKLGALPFLTFLLINYSPTLR